MHIDALERDRPGYRHRLKESFPAVMKVAQRYVMSGADVMIPGFTEPAGGEDHWEQSDEGDLFVRKAGSDWKRIEVRHRGIDFYDCLDYPHRTIFIENKMKWDKSEVKPYRMFYVNRMMDRYGSLQPNPEGQAWEVEEPPMFKGAGMTHRVYVCDPMYLHYGDL